MKKRILGLLLAVVMLMVFVPCSYAAEIAEEGTCGANAVYKLYDDGTLIISGEGDTNRSFRFLSEDIKSVIIEEGITGIADRAFDRCENLAEISIADSVNSIGNGAFNNTVYYNNQENWERGVLYCGNHILDADKTEVNGEYNIRNDIVCIANAAFYECGNLTSITLPETITNIGEQTFQRCESLETVEICGIVKTIGDNAFNECTSLTAIHIPYGAISIGNDAFGYCSNLSEISIPDSLRKIGMGAFEYSVYYDNQENWENGLLYIGNHLIASDDGICGEITIKEGTLNIADSALYYNEGITAITLPQSLRTMGRYSIRWCYNLTDIFIPSEVTRIDEEALPSTLKNIVVADDNSEYSSFDGNLYNKDRTKLINYAGGKKDSEFILPDKVTDIAQFAFYDCFNLMSILVTDNNAVFSSLDGVLFNKDKTVLMQYPIKKASRHYKVPLGVKSISSYAFRNCNNLTSVVLPNGLTDIGDRVFYDTDYLEAIFIPSSVENIDDMVFPNDREHIVQVYYSGTSRDWLDLTFMYTDMYLRGISVHYNTNGIPTPIIGEFNAPDDNGDGTYKITVPVEDIPYDCTAIAVFYADGAVSEVKQMAVTLSDTSVEFTAQNSADSAKVFIWDELNGMYPLCESKANKTV